MISDKYLLPDEAIYVFYSRIVICSRTSKTEGSN